LVSVLIFIRSESNRRLNASKLTDISA